MRGGTRHGAGRPIAADPTTPISIRLTAAQHETYARLGGATWLKALLDLMRKFETKKIPLEPEGPRG